MSFKILIANFIFIAIGGTGATIYDPTQNHVYTYSGGPFDPPNWHDTCQSTITFQNPFHISGPLTLKDPLPQLSFFGGVDDKPNEIRVINNGFGIFFKFVYHELNAPKIYGGPLKSDLYQFDSFSYHYEREHTVFATVPNQRLEFQFLHFNLKYGTFENAIDKPNGLAVIAVRYRDLYGLTLTQPIFPIPFFDMIGSVYHPFTEIVQRPGSFSYAKILNFNLNKIPEHYSFKGSLTTPPCYENVQWFTLRLPRIMDGSELDKFKNYKTWFPQSFTNRPLTPRNGRDIIQYF